MDKPVKETLTIEFKSDLKCLPLDDLYKELVAMANTDGGMLFLGMEDNGDATGVHAQHADIIEMAAKVQTHTVPALYPEVHMEHWDGVDVLVFEIKSSHQLVMTSDGRYLRRRLMQNGQPQAIPMTIIQEKGMIESHVERFGSITRAEATDLCKCDKNHAYYILRQMVESGTLLPVGNGRNVHYVKKD